MGFALLDISSNRPSCLEWGCLEANKKDPIHIRLNQLHSQLTEVVERWNPEHMAVEEPFVAPQRGAKSAVAVGQAQAVAFLVAAANSVEVHRYGPSQVKSSIAGYGASTKEQLQRTVQLILGMDPTPISQDASDAIAIGLCYFQQSQMNQRIREI
jgi:crossover junction endodeoxyribonuclease RuvC